MATATAFATGVLAYLTLALSPPAQAPPQAPPTIVAGSPMTLEAQLVDQGGEVVRGAPVNFVVIYDWPDDKPWGDKRYEGAASANLSTPGHRRFIASFCRFADTLDLEVVPRERRPR